MVEKTSSEKEELEAFPQPKTDKEIPPVEEPKAGKVEIETSNLFDFEEKFPTAPPPKPKAAPERRSSPPPPRREPEPVKRVKREEPEPEFLEEMKKGHPEPSTDEPDSPDLSSGERRKEPRRSEKIQIRIPSLTYQKIGFIVVIIIGGYLLWSAYSHFTPKKSAPSKPIPKKVVSSLPSRPAAPTEPAARPEPKITHPPSPPPAPVVPKTPASDDKEIENIKNLLENIRQANLRKNIDLFMSCYSAGFKDREGKKKETLRNWENFTYINLSYTLREHSISADTAGAKVAWVVVYSSKGGGPTQQSETVLDVTLNKEPGGWKIKNIKPTS